MEDKEFGAFLALLMCSDPWPCEDEYQGILLDFADTEASKRGFDGWIEAYHALA